MGSVKLAFEKQLQNERTLKIQVCVRAPTQVLKLRNIVTVMSHHLLLRICLSCRLVLNSGQKYPEI